MSYLKNIFFSFFNNNKKNIWRIGGETKRCTPRNPGVMSNYLSCLLLIFLFSVTCLFLQDQNSFQHRSPQRPALQRCLGEGGGKGILGPQAFHYCLKFFSADHDCTRTCQRSLFRREIQFFLRRKIIGCFLSP